jgi:hypothetical protein
MNLKATLGIISGIVALMLVFAASRNDRDEITELFQSNEQTITALEQRLEDLQQTVSRQSRLINQLRAEPFGQAEAESAQAPIDSENLWATLESFVEQHLEDREERKRGEQRQRMEEAMAKSRERRNQKLAKQLGLNPFQSEQLAKLRAELQAKRREAMMPEEGEPFDPKRMAEILKQLEEEERTRLAGFLTADQVDQYKSRSSRSVQFMSMGSDGNVSGAISEVLNLSIQLPPGVIGTSSIQMTVQGDGVGDDVSGAFVIEENDFFPEDEVPGEIILDDGEPPLPPFPPFPPPPFPIPPPPE